MKAVIINKVLIVEAESEEETVLLKEWRKNWHRLPKAEKWLEALYFESPVEAR